MPESTLERAVKALERTAPAVAHVLKLYPFVKGTPDRVILYRCGHYRLAELKAPDGVVEPRQAAWHRRSAKRGAPVDVPRSVAGLDVCPFADCNMV